MEPVDLPPHLPRSTATPPTAPTRAPNTPPTPTFVTASQSPNPSPPELRVQQQQISGNRSIQVPQSALVRDHHSQRLPEWPHDHRYHALASPSRHSPTFARSPSPTDQWPSSSLPNRIRGQDEKDCYDGAVRADSRYDSVTGNIGTSNHLEKQRPSVSHAQHSRSVDHSRPSYSRTVEDVDLAADDEIDEKLEKRQTLRALMHLALGAPFMSVIIMLYVIIIAMFTVLTSPLRLCNHSSLRMRIIRYLLPPLNLQRRCIFARAVEVPLIRSSAPKAQTEASNAAIAHHSSSYEDASDSCSAITLLTTHILSPVVSLALCVFAWITAFAWLPSAMLSHERTGGVSDDERRMAERLVGAWYSWLDMCVREEEERRRGRLRKSNRELQSTKGGGAVV